MDFKTRHYLSLAQYKLGLTLAKDRRFAALELVEARKDLHRMRRRRLSRKETVLCAGLRCMETVRETEDADEGRVADHVAKVMLHAVFALDIYYPEEA